LNKTILKKATTLLAQNPARTFKAKELARKIGIPKFGMASEMVFASSSTFRGNFVGKSRDFEREGWLLF